MYRTIVVAGLSYVLTGVSGQAEAGSPVGRFVSDHPGTRVVERAGRVRQIYGRPFADGASALESAESFRTRHAGVFGALPGELVLVPDGPDAGQPVMYQPHTGTYKFTTYVYTQQRAGVPVFGSALKVLVRNEPGHPVVLANADLRDLGAFAVDRRAMAARPQAAAASAAIRRAGELAIVAGQPRVLSVRSVIWAGAGDEAVAPRLANESVVAVDEDRWLILTDARTGEALHEEHLVYFVDVAGQVDANATPAVGSDDCEAEAATAMPYLRVTADGNEAFSDASGDFLIPNPGAADVMVSATVADGMWFDVANLLGDELVESLLVTPPGPADLLFNPANDDELVRAQVNGYVHANLVRDYVLQFNPAYPSLGNGDFPVTVNRTDMFCPGNAWYSGATINFCSAADGFPNTAFSSVVYHEYGHHLVTAGGSGQGAYGEGMSDVISVLVLDAPEVGVGFFGDCGGSLRNADNSCQYDPGNCSSCGSGSHACGNLLSGCVWSTRENLVATEPVDYRDILSDLAINSILLHTGSSITASITVDFLTLDDDDADIFNGTPHYDEINSGFADHGLAGPSVLLAFDFPSGLPEMTAPGGGTTVPVEVSGVAQTPQPATGSLFVDTGGGFVEIPMTEVTPNVYDAVFPAAACGTQISYYFSAETTGGDTAVWPVNAPLDSLVAFSGTGTAAVFADDFEADLGWTVTDGGITDGGWERAVPIDHGTCDRGNPGLDGDGSGMCFVTDNDSTPLCNSDVDHGSTTLTSPIMDASQPGFITYRRWYSNAQGDWPLQDVFVVEVSGDGGVGWITLETVGPDGPEVDGGWIQKTFWLGDFIAPTSQFRIRFTASDTDPPSLVEAGVDGVELSAVTCALAPPFDLTGDGVVGVEDLIEVITTWNRDAVAPDPDVGAAGAGLAELLGVLANLGTSAGAPAGNLQREGW
jgi:hypothetical protein